MASTWTVTLSLVITSCCGTSSTCSIMLTLRPDRLHEGRQDGDAGLERAGVAAETLDRVFVALRHDLDGANEDDRRQGDQDKRKKMQRARGGQDHAGNLTQLSRPDKIG